MTGLQKLLVRMNYCVMSEMLDWAKVELIYSLGELTQFLKMLKTVETTLWNNVDSVNNDLDFG
jgi:hypothetical protein